MLGDEIGVDDAYSRQPMGSLVYTADDDLSYTSNNVELMNHANVCNRKFNIAILPRHLIESEMKRLYKLRRSE